MSNYIIEEIRIDPPYDINYVKVQGWDLTEKIYYKLEPKIKMEEGPFFGRYGHGSFVQILGCEDYAITDSGILYNRHTNKIIQPMVEFNDFGKITRAYFTLNKKKIDIGDLVMLSRFRVNPDNFRVSYTLLTDGIAVYFKTFNFCFKVPKELTNFGLDEDGVEIHDFRAMKFCDEYMICRNQWGLFVSENGAIYDAPAKKFRPIYINKHSSNHGNVVEFRSLVYDRYGGVTPLPEFLVSEWSGILPPKGITYIDDSDIPTAATLKTYNIADFRARGVRRKDPTKINLDLLRKRAKKRIALSNTIHKEIARALNLIRKADANEV